MGRIGDASDGRTVPRWVGALTGLLVVAVALAVGHVVAILIAGAASPLFAVGETLIDASPQWLKEWAMPDLRRERQGRRCWSGSPRGPRRTRRRARRRRTPTSMARLRGPRRSDRRRRGGRARSARSRARRGSFHPSSPVVPEPEPSRCSRVLGDGAARRRRPNETTSRSRASRRGSTDAGSWSRRSPWGPPPLRPAGVSRLLRNREVAATGRNGLRVPAAEEHRRPVARGGGARRPPAWLPSTRRRRRSIASTPPCCVPHVDRRGLAAAHPRHGRPRDRARPTRRAASTATDRARHHADLRVERGRRALHRQRPVDRRAARADPATRPVCADGADQMVCTLGRTASPIGTPTAVALDGRDAMLAVAMNGEPLPIEHGFPVRMVVPGSLRLRVGDEVGRRPGAHDASRRTTPYWVQRGLGAAGADQDVVADRHAAAPAPISAGRVAVAGVAWAQHRGIDARRGPRRRRRRGTRRRLATAGHDRHLAAVGLATGTATAGRPHADGPRHRSDRRRADRPGRPSRSRSGATGWHTIEVTVT